MGTRIDLGIVHRLVASLLEVMPSPVVVVQLGEPEPRPGDNVGAWCRVVRVDYAADPGPDDGKSGDFGTVTVAVNCAVSTGQTRLSSYALSSLMSIVGQQLDGRRAADDATGHVLIMQRPQITADEDPEDQRGIRTGVVICTGLVSRSAGNSITSFLTTSKPAA